VNTPLKMTLAAALSLGASIAVAPAAHAEDYECRGTLGAVTVVGSVIVPDDATCTLDGTNIQGNLTVKSRATLVATGIELTGTVQGESPTKVDVRGSQIGNGFSISKGGELGSIVLMTTSVTGDVQLADNRGSVQLDGNTVGGSVQVNKNTGGVTITGNGITNGLQCQDNNPFPTGGGNIAAQKQGQCERL